MSGDRARYHVLVTGGGTVAPIDDVRVITNVSSGRFSAALTEAFIERGCAVWHLATPTATRPFAQPERMDREPLLANLSLVELERGTVADYAQGVRDVLDSHPIDIAVMAAAVSDYEPVPHAGKIESDQEELVIRCRRTPKVIAHVKEWAPKVFLVGFKMLSGVSVTRLVDAASRLARESHADLVVANDVKLVHTPAHCVHLVVADGTFETLGPASNLAGLVVGRITAMARAHGITPRQA